MTKTKSFEIDKFPFLHHYTTKGGLDGILTTQTLHATYYKSLNDTSEVIHLKQALINHLENPLKEIIYQWASSESKRLDYIKSCGGIDAFYKNEVNALINSFYNVTYGDGKILPFAEPFITSFCAHSHDSNYEKENGLLSQWRSYSAGRNEGGFAIVFDTEKLHELIQLEGQHYHTPVLLFGDVFYEGNQELFVSEFKPLLMGLEEHFEKMVSSDLGGIAPDMFSTFVSSTCRFKHRAFSEEREVRIVMSPDTQETLDKLKKIDPDQDFTSKGIKEKHPRDDGLNHTIKLFDFKKDTKLPVTKIIIGPHRNQEDNLHFTKKLIGGLNLDIEIQCSETPYSGA